MFILICIIGKNKITRSKSSQYKISKQKPCVNISEYYNSIVILFLVAISKPQKNKACFILSPRDSAVTGVRIINTCTPGLRFNFDTFSI
jgi:hypothetical protein